MLTMYPGPQSEHEEARGRDDLESVPIALCVRSFHPALSGPRLTKLLSAHICIYRWYRHLGARLKLPPEQERPAGRACAEILASALANICSHQYLNKIIMNSSGPNVPASGCHAGAAIARSLRKLRGLPAIRA
jgi:hypothetical protein